MTHEPAPKASTPLVLPRHCDGIEAFIAPPAGRGGDTGRLGGSLACYRASAHLATRKVVWDVRGHHGDAIMASLMAAADLLSRIPAGVVTTIYMSAPMAAAVARGERTHTQAAGSSAMDLTSLLRLLETEAHRVDCRFDSAQARTSAGMKLADSIKHTDADALDAVLRIDAA